MRALLQIYFLIWRLAQCDDMYLKQKNNDVIKIKMKKSAPRVPPANTPLDTVKWCMISVSGLMHYSYIK